MSDLISRSELLKRFLVNKDGHRIPERDCDNLEVTVSIKDVKTIIKEQPTAYDIDKVVEELEKLKYKGSVTKTEMLITKACVNKAIEIVKQGGVSDDVCEWKRDDMCDTVYKVCGGCFTSEYQKDFKYCPYCGKKIKVVK